MSIPGASLALTALEAGAIGLLQQLHSRAPRGFQWSPVDPKTGLPITQDVNGQPIVNTLVAQVTIEEDHDDALFITEHPVEQGAAISDHTFKLPARLRLVLGWSDSPSPKNTGLLFIPANIIGGISSTANAFSSSPSYVKGVYERLLALQESSVPVSIFTGKRAYSNMLLRSVRTTTNKDTENSLVVRMEAHQVIIVNTQVVSIASAAVQANPQKTSPTVDNGTVQPKPVSSLSGTQMDLVDPDWSKA